MFGCRKFVSIVALDFDAELVDNEFLFLWAFDSDADVVVAIVTDADPLAGSINAVLLGRVLFVDFVDVVNVVAVNSREGCGGFFFDKFVDFLCFALLFLPLLCEFFDEVGGEDDALNAEAFSVILSFCRVSC